MCWDWLEGNILFLLWEILINIDIENEAVINDPKNRIIIVFIFHEIILDNRKISLNVLIVGGAEILIAIKINHQNVILGDIIINPLNNIIFRDLYFIYKSFTRKKRADDDIPWAIIIIIAPINPILFIEKIPIKTNAMCATDE